MQMYNMPSKYLWMAAPFIFVIFWSGGYTFAKLGLAHIEPMTMLAVRYGIAVIILMPCIFFVSIKWPTKIQDWVIMIITGFLIQYVYFGLTYLAFKKGINAGTAAIIMSLQPILVAAMLPSRSKNRNSISPWVGLIIGLIGVVLVTISNNSLGPSPLTALFLALGALAGITIATIFEKLHRKKTDPVISGLVQYLTGVFILTPIAFMTETMEIDWQPELIVALAYLVVANSIVSVGIYIALVQRDDVTKISSLFYLVPPLAMFIAWYVLGEPVTGLAVIGFILSALGVSIVHKKAPKRAETS